MISSYASGIELGQNIEVRQGELAKRGQQRRPNGLLDMTGYKHPRNQAEVLEMVRKNSTARTRQQTVVARLWVSGIGALWNGVVHHVSEQKSNGPIEATVLVNSPGTDEMDHPLRLILHQAASRLSPTENAPSKMWAVSMSVIVDCGHPRRYSGKSELWSNPCIRRCTSVEDCCREGVEP